MRTELDSDRAAHWIPSWTDGQRLISLWDIVKIIKSEMLYELGCMSSEVSGGILGFGHAKIGSKEEPIRNEIRDGLKTLLPGYIDALKEANLRISLITISDLLSNIGSGIAMTFGQLESHLRELSNTVQRELRCSTVLRLSPETSQYFHASKLFGDLVAERFPSA